MLPSLADAHILGKDCVPILARPQVCAFSGLRSKNRKTRLFSAF
jgi:hypothetical protein